MEVFRYDQLNYAEFTYTGIQRDGVLFLGTALTRIEGIQVIKSYSFDIRIDPVVSMGQEPIVCKIFFGENIRFEVSADMEVHDLKALEVGITDQPVEFFEMNDKLYFLNGHDFKVLDGVVKDVHESAYIPTLTMGRDPEKGGGEFFEAFNLIGSKFKDSFSADGKYNKFKLSLDVLDPEEVLVNADNEDLKENIDFTVDRPGGYVEFKEKEYTETFSGDGNTKIFQLSKVGLSKTGVVAVVDGMSMNEKREITETFKGDGVKTVFKVCAGKLNHELIEGILGNLRIRSDGYSEAVFSGDGVITLFNLGRTNIDAAVIEANIEGVLYDDQGYITETFSGDGSSKVFNLSRQNILADEVKVSYDSMIMSENGEITETFSGDGEKTQLKLGKANIGEELIEITIDGEAYNEGVSHGRRLGSGVEVNRETGVVDLYRTPEAGLKNITVKYHASTFTINRVTGIVSMADPVPKGEDNFQVKYKDETFAADRVAGTVTFVNAPLEGKNNIEIKFKHASTITVNYDTGEVTFPSAPALDAAVKIRYRGDTFKVDREASSVEFNAAPSKATDNVQIIFYKLPFDKGTDNVVITAAKTYPEYRPMIYNCTFGVVFGGYNDTRIILSGNKNHKNTQFVSGLLDPHYWPSDAYENLGSSREAITGYKKHYDICIVEKEHSKYRIECSLENGEVRYKTFPLNDTVGNVSHRTNQLINNSPVSFDHKGVWMLNQSSIRTEKNVDLMSENINLRLLAEPNRNSAISADFDDKYMIVINKKAYVWDYLNNAWFIWDNMPAACFMEYNGYLYFGDDKGMIHRFKKDDETDCYTDNGQAIHSYYYTKLLNLNYDEYTKYVKKFFVQVKPSARGSVDIYYRTDRKELDFVKTLRMSLFHYSLFDYSTVSYIESELPKEWAMKMKAKKIVIFQALFKNDRLGDSMTIMSMGIQNKVQSLVK